MNHKDGKIAQKIIELQNHNGTWRQTFHSLSQPNKRFSLTTE